MPQIIYASQVPEVDCDLGQLANRVLLLWMDAVLCTFSKGAKLLEVEVLT